jgi:hypothetical protein
MSYNTPRRQDSVGDQRPRRQDSVGDQRPRRQDSKYQTDDIIPSKPRKQEFITANTGYGTQEPIEKMKFLEGLNSLKLSSNLSDLCAQVNINANTMLDMVQTSCDNTYCFLFNVDQSVYTNTWEASILKAYDIGSYITMSEMLFNDIATMKWNIYCAYKANKMTDNIVKFIGIVGGICTYFEQIDKINDYTTKYYHQLKSDHTYNDIKLL